MYFSRLILYSLLVIVWHITFVYSQSPTSATYGSLYVANGFEYKVYGSHLFLQNDRYKQPGIIGTERSQPIGYVTFTSDYILSVNSNTFVDGYVKSEIDGSFIFPVGDNKNHYKPVHLTESKNAYVAYYNTSPKIAITDYYNGEINTYALPLGAPFINTSETLNLILAEEYWDINGDRPTKISLMWDVHSNLFDLVPSIDKLTIWGWKEDSWHIIPSSYDKKSIIDGNSSDMVQGTITTDNAILPRDYNVYTIGLLPNTVDFRVEISVLRKQDKELELFYNEYPITFTISVQNLSDSSAFDVMVTNILPKELLYDAAVGDGNYDPKTGIWHIEQVPKNDVASIQITAIINASDDNMKITNTIQSIKSNTIDLNKTKDILSVSFFVSSSELESKYDIVTANGDGFNDYLTFKGDYDSANLSVQIYNPEGYLIYETAQYDTQGNHFLGLANRGLLTNNTKLSEGFYFYFVTDGIKNDTGYFYLTY